MAKKNNLLRGKNMKGRRELNIKKNFLGCNNISIYCVLPSAA